MKRSTTRRAVLATAVRGGPPALAACGGGRTPPSTAPTAPGEITGKVVFALSGAEQQHPPAILEAYQAKFPKLTVETIRGAWDPTLEKVAEMVAAATPPDLWYAEDGRATGWGPRGWIRDLAPYAKRDMKESDYLGFNASRRSW